MLIDGFTLFGSWPGLPYDHPIDHLLNGLNRNKIDRACTLATQGIFFDDASGNETTWTVCQQDPRLVPIGIADPRDGGLDQVDLCKERGFKLMALFPAAQEWSIRSIVARRLFRLLSEAGLPVLIQAGNDGDASAILEATQGMDVPIILLDVSVRTLNEAINVVQLRPQTYLSTRLLCGGDTIEYLVQAIGPEALIFSSQFPISCFSSAFLTAQYATINDAARQAIMGGNIDKLLQAQVGAAT
ncbi:MAG TPA: amidohydrolase family protein [Armatimonadota bacterium]|jgi:predicted TIM-barrel fold metal-dependent hydrolase